MKMQMKQRAAAGMMTGAAALAIAGFTALGSIFDYPQILKAPTPEILDSYRENQTAITGWFLALVISAALLAPIGVLLGRITGGILGKWITGVGIAAATVQVIGLSRWVLLIPGISDDATVPARTEGAHRTFEQLHFWLGTILGETVGYALTATFTVLVVIAFSLGEFRFELNALLTDRGLNIAAAAVVIGLCTFHVSFVAWRRSFTNHSGFAELPYSFKSLLWVLDSNSSFEFLVLRRCQR